MCVALSAPTPLLPCFHGARLPTSPPQTIQDEGTSCVLDLLKFLTIKKFEEKIGQNHEREVNI